MDRPSCRLILLLLAFNFFAVLHAIPSPPTIIRQADKEIIFDPRINIEIPCVAKGDPAPKYTWTKDKRIYDPSSQNNRVAMKSNAGTLIITNPSAADQGWYQCNATNQDGRVVPVSLLHALQDHPRAAR